MSTKLELGRLERMRLRDAWENEAGDFTPWLALPDNIALLGDAIGIELGVDATEIEVGPFRADIVCRNLADDALVLIENQIERTDHSHLGQLLTYAAGLEAVTVVWIAERFTDEHRAALDWLNTITEAKFNFFGLEIELWRIGTSPAAPKFNVVCQPNEWVRNKAQTIGGEGSTSIGQLRLEYWTQFKAFLTEARSPLRSSTPGTKSSLRFALGRAGVGLRAVAALFDPIEGGDASIRAQLTMEHGDAPGLFRALILRKADIEAKMGEPLTWFADEAVRRRRVFVRTAADIQDRSDWPRQHEWLKTKLEKMHSGFAPIIRELQPIEVDAEEGV